MRNKICLVFVFGIALFSYEIGFAQAPNWHWAKSAGGTEIDDGTCIAIDGDGFLYVAGYFYSPTIIFGNDTLVKTDSSGTLNDLFIAKYDLTGNVIWAQSTGGAGSDLAKSIAVDINGNTYLTGFFSGATCTFDSVTVTGGQFTNVFIAKYNSAGHALWVKSAGGSGHNIGNSIAVDATGNCYITGAFRSPAITFGNTTLLNNSSTDASVFTVKYDQFGNVLWAKGSNGQITANAYVTAGRGIAVDANGNTYITGSFESSVITFDSITFLSSIGANMFLVKYDTSGNVIWSRCAGGLNLGYALGKSIAVDPSGYVYVTGDFNTDSLVLGNTILVNIIVGGTANIFTVKYDALGNALWAKAAGGGSHSNGIAVSANGNSYITGNFFGSPISLGTYTLTNASSSADFFVASYDSSGNALWAKSAYGRGAEVSQAIAISANGDCYITGHFQNDTVSFGSTILISGATMHQDIFVAKLATTTSLIEQPNSSNSIILYPNPTISQLNITSIQPIDEIKITDVMGQFIYRAKPKEKNVMLQLGYELSGGIYFVTVTSGEQTATRKLVVQR